MKIEIGKTYKTRSGVPVRILAVDLANAPYTVAVFREGEGVYTYTSEGVFNAECGDNHTDLIEVSEWDDFKMDDKVMVREIGRAWHRRHFAGVSEKGKPMAFPDGRSSWAHMGKPLAWDECRRPTEEELE